jgi:type I site-specific restriction endonuclease
MLAVVEAKAAYKLPGDGLPQAKAYAEALGLRFAYSTNGHGTGKTAVAFQICWKLWSMRWNRWANTTTPRFFTSPIEIS